MKRVLLFAVAIVSVCTAFSQKHTKAAAVKNPSILAENDWEHWHYHADTDQMTSKLIRFAQVNAKDTLYLNFPYAGGSIGTFCIRNMNGINDVYFAVTKGRIGGLGDQSVDVRLRFDDEQPIVYKFSYSADRDKHFAYATHDASAEIIVKLKKAKRLRMEIEFFGSDQRILEFNVAGLKWDYKDKEAETMAERRKLGWNYRTDTDKMTSEISRYAYVEAKDKIIFKNNDEAYVYLVVLSIDSVNRLIFEVSQGELEENYNHVQLRLRFDEDTAKYYSFFSASNGKKNLCYVNRSTANKLIARLKKAKRLLIEAEYPGEESKISEFDVSGLKWNYIGKEDSPVVKKQEGSRSNNGSYENAFDRFFNNNTGSGTNVTTHITTTHTNMDGNNSNITTETSINGAVVDASESIDKVNDVITVHCKYKNNTTESKTITINASFLDKNDSEITVKSISLTCSPNGEVSTDLSANGILNKYKTYKIEIE
jgi:hypothetical protein